MDPQAVSASVQAFASVVAAVATILIGVFAWRSHQTATRALDAARRQAETAEDAVAAANLSGPVAEFSRTIRPGRASKGGTRWAEHVGHGHDR